MQVEAEVERLGQFTPIRPSPVYGGQKIMAQMKFLGIDPEILVGTPGRVIDLLDRGIINFDNIRFVVLDEVDRMLDIGFRDDIRNMLSRIKGDARMRERRATPRRPAEQCSAAEHRPSRQRPPIAGIRRFSFPRRSRAEIEKLGPAVHARAGGKTDRPRRR